MKIKSKITLGFGTVLLATGILFNVGIRNILTEKLETTIKESLNQIMISTTETFKYRTSINLSKSNSDKLKNESEYLTSYLSLHNECTAEIRDNSNNILSNNIDVQFEDDIDKQLPQVANNSALVKIRYIDSNAYGILSYPVYINSEKEGTFSIVKDYSALYENNIDTINLITIIELVTFIGIFFTAYIITTTVTGPIAELTVAVKKIEEGNYDFSIKPKRKDEVGILASEFLKMKDKISSQFQTIKEEQLKVITLEKHKKQFFDNVTHEIKTPLTAITGYAEMLKDDISDDEEFKHRALERIYSESNRVNKLVLDLINVTKGQSQAEESFTDVNIKNLIFTIVEDMKLKASKYKLSLDTTIANGIIIGQRNRLKQLFINLIDNAIKYSSNGKIITITSYTENDKYIIKIKNHSEIIPEKIYNSIFDPFIKTNNTTEKYSSGLGLYISQEIVNTNNGEITITNGEIVTVTVIFNLIKNSSC